MVDWSSDECCKKVRTNLQNPCWCIARTRGFGNFDLTICHLSVSHADCELCWQWFFNVEYQVRRLQSLCVLIHSPTRKMMMLKRYNNIYYNKYNLETFPLKYCLLRFACDCWRIVACMRVCACARARVCLVRACVRFYLLLCCCGCASDLVYNWCVALLVFPRYRAKSVVQFLHMSIGCCLFCLTGQIICQFLLSLSYS